MLDDAVSQKTHRCTGKGILSAVSNSVRVGRAFKRWTTLQALRRDLLGFFKSTQDPIKAALLSHRKFSLQFAGGSPAQIQICLCVWRLVDENLHKYEFLPILWKKLANSIVAPSRDSCSQPILLPNLGKFHDATFTSPVSINCYFCDEPLASVYAISILDA